MNVLVWGEKRFRFPFPSDFPLSWVAPPSTHLARAGSFAGAGHQGAAAQGGLRVAGGVFPSLEGRAIGWRCDANEKNGRTHIKPFKKKKKRKKKKKHMAVAQKSGTKMAHWQMEPYFSFFCVIYFVLVGVVITIGHLCVISERLNRMEVVQAQTCV